MGLTAVGLVLSLLAVHQGSRLAAPLLGEEPGRRRRVWLLCLIPYVAGGGLFVLAALFNPYGRVFMLTSGLAHFGGGAWLLWLPAWTRGLPATSPALLVPRSWAWIGAGALSALFCLAVLGPAVRF